MKRFVATAGAGVRTKVSVLAGVLAMFALPGSGQAPSESTVAEINGPQNGSPTATTPAKDSSGVPHCKIEGDDEIAIDCSYRALSPARLGGEEQPRIALNRAVFSFQLHNESQMHIELTFTNEGKTRNSIGRLVYVAIDDDKGQNHVRRPLPHVDFGRLEPNQPLTFSESFLAPAFSKGHYWIRLWIPSTDPMLKFDSAHNLLLCNEGVPDRATGLNAVAEFTATDAPKRRRD